MDDIRNTLSDDAAGSAKDRGANGNGGGKGGKRYLYGISGFFL